MRRLSHPLRSLLVAVAAFGLTGGAVFAAQSLPARHGITHVAQTSESVDPTETAETPEPAETPDAAETPEPAETPDTNQAADPTRPHNHGWFVSQAAQGATPAGFANHGAYVSSIAKGTDGKPAAAGKSHGASGQAHGHNGN